jgi:Fe-S-cluster containining protein
MSDGALIQIVDAALAGATRRAGPWLVCRPGCCECCIGPFAIDARDVRLLQQGLRSVDSAIAARVRARARSYPLDASAAENEPCPVLDPETGTCDLYAWRPITCRTFGPPVRFAGGSLAICDLCFVGATPEQIDACAVEIDASVLIGEGPEAIVADAINSCSN